MTKLSVSQRVVDEHQIERHFNANDLAELYRFEPDILENEADERPTPVIPKVKFKIDDYDPIFKSR